MVLNNWKVWRCENNDYYVQVLTKTVPCGSKKGQEKKKAF